MLEKGSVKETNMDETHLTLWLWVYRIAAIGMFSICIILVLIIGSVLGDWKKRLKKEG